MKELELVKAIEDFLQRSGMAETTFGLKVMGDPTFYRELKNTDRRCLMETHKKIHAFIAKHKPKKRTPKQSH